MVREHMLLCVGALALIGCTLPVDGISQRGPDGMDAAALRDAAGREVDAGLDAAVASDASVDADAGRDASLPRDAGRPGCSACAGCCDRGVCIDPPTPARCGVGGAMCRACDEVADGCDATGVCVCGSGPACFAGQRCAAGTCVCDATSCPSGCCDGNVCLPSTDVTCGVAGDACRDCLSSSSSDRCTGGECVCGFGSECSGDDVCSSGSCVD